MNPAELDLDSFLKDLEFLVNIDSGSGDLDGVSAVAAFFEEEFTKLGWQVIRRDVGSDVGPCLEILSPGNRNDHDILLLGHMDTVFPKGTAAERPFHIEGNRAYGPGVMDMKSGDLFALYLARLFHKTGEATPSICLALNSHEEIGSELSRGWIEDLARRSHHAFILEPGRANGDLVFERKGTGRYCLKFHGKAAHSGVDPQNGASAINELACWVTELHKLTDFETGLTLNVGLISGGTSVNAIAEFAEAEVDLRFVSQDQADLVEARIREMAQNVFTPNVTVSVTGGVSRPPMNASDDALTLCRKVDAIAADLGVKIGWQKTGGGSDGNFTADVGIPTIDGMGPVGGRAHSREEYLEVDSISERFALLAGIVRALKA
nr:M20 family metallopeptidase [uncultured Cohaesibacter sp.]